MSKKDVNLRWLTVILFFLFIGECKSTKRIQRRFMWKQMDDTMDDIFDSMASSARAMKSMIGEFIPGMTTAPTHSIMHSNILDYLPTETTKIKYIIHSPTTKPMKILKMNAPKKNVKIMSIHKPLIENVQTKHNNRPKYNFGNAATLRQMEKEQEPIAEGHNPVKISNENHNHKQQHNDDIISAKINEFGSEWQPMSTVKPYPMSHLYTNVLSETLPQPEKHAYNDAVHDIQNIFEESKRKNSYEVTEHTPEESVAVSYKEHFDNSRGFSPVHSPPLSSKLQHPSRSGAGTLTGRSHIAATRTTAKTTTTTTTTTTEAPNYPASFLKKHQERPVNIPKQLKIFHETNRSSLEMASKPKPKPTQLVQLPSNHQNHAFLGPTIYPTMLELSTTKVVRKPEKLVQSTSDEHFIPKPTKKLNTERPRDIRQRGSIKFGDKLSELYKR